MVKSEKKHSEYLYKDIWSQDLNCNYKTIRQKLQSFEKDNQNPLDFPITQTELESKIRNLKSNQIMRPWQ